MKEKVYLINYTDTSDNTKGTICASREKYLSETAKLAVRKWFKDLWMGATWDNINNMLIQLKHDGYTKFKNYEIFAEETYLV